MASFAKQIRCRATRFYKTDGWDYVVECWTDEDIDEETKDCATLDDAIKKVHNLVSPINEIRKEREAWYHG
jgi:hypothetical protein